MAESAVRVRCAERIEPGPRGAPEYRRMQRRGFPFGESHGSTSFISMNGIPQRDDLLGLREYLEKKITDIEVRTEKRADNLALDVGQLAAACFRFEKHVDKQYGESLEFLTAIFARLRELELAVFGRSLGAAELMPANSDEPEG